MGIFVCFNDVISVIIGFPDPIAIVQQARTLQKKKRLSSKPTTSTKAVKTKEPLKPKPNQAKRSDIWSNIQPRLHNLCITAHHLVHGPSCPFLIKAHFSNSNYVKSSLGIGNRNSESELRVQKSEFGNRSTKFGKRSSENRNRSTEFGKRSSEFGKRRSEYGKQKSEYGVRKAELGVRKAELGARKAENGARCPGGLP